MNGLEFLLVVAAGLSMTPPGWAADPVKVVLIVSSTEPLDAYARQTNMDGATDVEMLIVAIAAVSFHKAKGEVIFRKQDHRALQWMYGFKIKVDPKSAWPTPELTREIGIADMQVPVQNKH